MAGRVRESAEPATQLTPRLVAAWEARLGVDRKRLARPTHFAGTAGLREWQSGLDIVPADADEFRAVRFDRRMSMTASYCALHSAARTERTLERIAAEPYELLMVAVTSMRGRTVVRQAGQEFEYSAGDLVFVATTSPFTLSASAVTDPCGHVIPLAMLGRHRRLAEQPRRPVSKQTPLARAAAGFARRFAADTAALDGPAPSADAELAAVDLFTAALAELACDHDYRLQDDTLFHHQVVLDLIARRHRDPDFTPDSIAVELHLSRRQLYRLFEHTDQSLAARIADARVGTAREMLVSNPWLPIGSVSAASGFRSVATFRNRFKSRYGVGPIDYRHQVTPSTGS
ncbi:AraC family transcriptional regulator [Gordonia sp. HY002]|uniref:AraC family transcriptional regulator n=1 Tax=Gordonia zhenghanii TaxID=2911516 RepID=UPI001EF00083|nr:AraC family transcriptional regulator [Gordonia zhenghanii]MCF8569114.1 AraC family transcriptional regulator [Gordonia zhenghanii]MCF8603433.1 AraC family transcriptional regulator [Gordonia zhenghanii]